MSKQNARVVFTVLIALGLIIAIFTTVQARLGSADSNSASSSIFSSLNNHASAFGRADVSARTGMFSQYQTVNPGSGHDCGAPANSAADD